MQRLIAPTLTLITLLLAACGSGGAAPVPASRSVSITTGSLTISNPWARATQRDTANVEPAPAASTMDSDAIGAAYMTISNSAATADTLLGASTSIAQAAELHTMTMAGGIMQMRPIVGGLALPAHGQVALAPGGTHLMLIGLRRPLRLGDTFDVTLQFAKAPAVTFEVAARAN